MAKKSKKAKKIRQREEFDLARLAAELQPPVSTAGGHAWQLEEIRAARDAQLRGQFKQPARMAEAFRTDDALFTAYQNRLAPQRCTSVELRAAPGVRGAAVAAEASALYGPHGVGIAEGAMDDVSGCIANHGFAIGYNVPLARDDGDRIDLEHRYWPLEHVRWDATRRQLLTRIEKLPPELARTLPPDWTSTEVPIVHGDGRWVIYQKHQHEPWKHEAAVLAGAYVWARHAHALRDWAKASRSHGNAKVVGEMPAGVKLENEGGVLTKEATAFLHLLRAIGSLDSPVGIRPAGSKTDYIVNNSTAWQVWKELVLNADQAAARIYLGTDGILGSKGGAPGVDIQALFGVAFTIVQGDLGCIEAGFKSGVLEPWAAINFGDSSLAPTRKYLLPNPDEQAARDEQAKRWTNFYAAWKEHRANGFVGDQAAADEMAARFGVVAPKVADARGQIFQYDLELGVVSPNEAREVKGFAPRAGGDVTLPEQRAAAERAAAAAAATPGAGAAQ